MAFTRYHDDECRIEKQLQESTDQGRYILNVPGNGVNMPFIDDPHIRMQYWGANLTNNTVNLESDLRGLTRRMNRDCIDVNNYRRHEVSVEKREYSRYDKTITEQPRAINPAWNLRGLDRMNLDYPLLNPQENTCLQFQNNISTRILEKDYYQVNSKC